MTNAIDIATPAAAVRKPWRWRRFLILLGVALAGFVVFLAILPGFL